MQECEFKKEHRHFFLCTHICNAQFILISGTCGQNVSFHWVLFWGTLWVQCKIQHTHKKKKKEMEETEEKFG